MTTTYELYTNENGTPKAVEGKAPAIIERVEALETSVENLGTSVENFGTSVENLGTSVENLETSVETAQATADACLPLAGGTMTGSINFSVPVVINQTTDTSYTTIHGGTTNSDGARLVLCGKGGVDVGQFKLYAQNGTNSKTLVGDPDGALTWGNKSIICVKAWNGEDSWYRKYSDGFIEQGGVITADPIVTVTYPLAFTSHVASIFVNGCTGAAQNPEQLKLDRWPTLTYFGAKGCYSTQNNSGNMSLTGYWYACGY